ncbi:MAG: hypothetical protein ABH871_08640 [Pseudomonadota bacterium]
MGKRLLTCIVLIAIICSSAAVQAGYRRELSKATEMGRIYHPNDWNAELIWHATFFNKHFRDAFIKQHEKIKRIDPINAERFETEQMHRQVSGWDFLIVMYTREQYKSFSVYDDSFWRIELITADGEAVKPLSIEMLPITPYEERMFPFIDRWSKAYRVTFPKVPLRDEVELTMKSVVGESTLEWKVKQ